MVKSTDYERSMTEKIALVIGQCPKKRRLQKSQRLLIQLPKSSRAAKKTDAREVLYRKNINYK